MPAAAAPELVSDSDSSSAGYYRLNWRDSGSSEFILEEATGPSFSGATTLYRGPDTATLISGRSDGIYYYRIRGARPPVAWSNVVSVTVSHHPLSRALLFFALGATVFIVTLVVVVRGNQANRT